MTAWIADKVSGFISGLFGSDDEGNSVTAVSSEKVVKKAVAGYNSKSNEYATSSYGAGNIKATLGSMNADTHYARQEEHFANLASVTKVYLEGDAKGVFKIVRQENSVFKKATGQSAFA